jgi:hypothetical protein
MRWMKKLKKLKKWKIEKLQLRKNNIWKNVLGFLK